MTTGSRPISDAELQEALTPTAHLVVPVDLLARIEADVAVAPQRRPSILRLPRALEPGYPDQPSRWALVGLVALLVLALVAALALAQRPRPLPHANGQIDLEFRGGLIELQPDGSRAVARPFPELDEASAAWSPYGDLIVFWGMQQRKPRLILSDAAGSVRASVDPRAELDGRSIVPDPGPVSWSRDGRVIVVAGAARGLDRILRYDVADGRFQDLTPGEVYGGWPSVSPVDDTIAFLPSDQRRWGATPWIMGLDGSNPHPVFSGLPDGWHVGSGSASPLWSPDGQVLLFDAERLGTTRLFVVRRDGTGLIQLAPDLHGPQTGQWSPEGRQILFANDLGWLEDTETWVVDPDGSGLTLIQSNANPLGYSPDGTIILVTSPSCDPERRGQNLCVHGVVAIDRGTLHSTELVSADRLDALRPSDAHVGLGWLAWQPVDR